MRARILKGIQWFLLIWGGFSLVATVALAIYLITWFGAPTRDKIDSASPHDVRYVLEGCHLRDKQIEQVVHSYISSRGLLNGGIIDVFAIKISHVDESDFNTKPDAPNEHWFRGDNLPAILDAAVKLAAGWHNQFPWFPTEAELRSSEVYVYPMEINCCCGSVEPTMATLVFIRKSDNMLFYLSDKP